MTARFTAVSRHPCGACPARHRGRRARRSCGPSWRRARRCSWTAGGTPSARRTWGRSSSCSSSREPHAWIPLAREHSARTPLAAPLDSPRKCTDSRPCGRCSVRLLRARTFPCRAQADGMPLDALDTAHLSQVLALDGGYRPELVRHCLRVFGAAADGGGDVAAVPEAEAVEGAAPPGKEAALDAAKVRGTGDGVRAQRCGAAAACVLGDESVCSLFFFAGVPVRRPQGAPRHRGQGGRRRQAGEPSGAPAALHGRVAGGRAVGPAAAAAPGHAQRRGAGGRCARALCCALPASLSAQREVPHSPGTHTAAQARAPARCCAPFPCATCRPTRRRALPRCLPPAPCGRARTCSPSSLASRSGARQAAGPQGCRAQASPTPRSSFALAPCCSLAVCAGAGPDGGRPAAQVRARQPVARRRRRHAVHCALTALATRCNTLRSVSTLQRQRNHAYRAACSSARTRRSTCSTTCTC